VSRVFANESERANYWKQRALSAEGQLPVDACTGGAKAIHRRSLLSNIPYEDLDDQNRAIREWTALDVVFAVNEERRRRLPHDHPERKETN